MAIAGGRLMLKVGYRPTVLTGLTILTIGFLILLSFDQTTPRWLLLADMGLVGAGMGLVVLALLITVQNSVDRNQLGIATSLNQFSRSIGGAVGVAVMGAVLTMSLSSRLNDIQQSSGLPPEEVARLVQNPSALIEPVSRAHLPETLVGPLRNALGDALHNVFIVGVIFASLSLISGFWLPTRKVSMAERATEHLPASAVECEKLLMAEMTTIDPEHEPVAK
jgi:MFS family permease